MVSRTLQLLYAKGLCSGTPVGAYVDHRDGLGLLWKTYLLPLPRIETILQLVALLLYNNNNNNNNNKLGEEGTTNIVFERLAPCFICGCTEFQFWTAPQHACCVFPRSLKTRAPFPSFTSFRFIIHSHPLMSALPVKQRIINLVHIGPCIIVIVEE